MTKPSDNQLTAAIAESDPDAFRTLYNRYFEVLYRFVWRRTQNEEVAKDLIQELFLRVWQNREKLKPEKPMKPYLYRLAKNLTIDHFRRTKHTKTFLNIAHENESEFVINDNSDLIQIVREAIEELPEPIREAFKLNRFDGLKYREIAAMLDISIKTVESRMSKALKMLHEKLSNLLLLIL